MNRMRESDPRLFANKLRARRRFDTCAASHSTDVGTWEGQEPSAKTERLNTLEPERSRRGIRVKAGCRD
jgi:hypothetical protein